MRVWATIGRELSEDRIVPIGIYSTEEAASLVAKNRGTQYWRIEVVEYELDADWPK